MDSVFVQSQARSLQHDDVLFHAGTDVCETMVVLYQKYHRFLGFCRVGQGKKHMAACSLIPRSWRLHCLWFMLQMFNQVWSGKKPSFKVWVANFSLKNGLINTAQSTEIELLK